MQMDFSQLRNSLQQPYTRQAWQEILRFVFSGQINFDNKAEKITIEKGGGKNIERYASITLDDNINIAVVEIETKKEIQIARNRVALRDIVFNLIDQDRYHGLLVLYYSEDDHQQDYRLSFISSLTEFDSEGNIIKSQTHPKRFSYVLGANETCNTAAQRFLTLKTKTHKNQPPIQNKISIKDLLEAFSVEALNKEFFKKYKDIHYKSFWEYIANTPSYANLLLDKKQVQLSDQQKPIRDFIKKLLGRIVFLHFLQKKGWMGCSADSEVWENGEKQFMKNLFTSFVDKKHFYSSCLVDLFHNTLNNADRKNGIFKFTQTRVPYLNGGLFDDDQPQTNDINFPETYFEDLFEFFSQYNFTIDENSPEEQEVGIDPEMLGHIFENLLEDNKDKGTFYTPRQIVHYMCQTSLIEYLVTHLPHVDKNIVENFIRNSDIGNVKDKKNLIVANARHIEELLDKVKICDPAIGSGAFPMGMLQEIFKAKLSLDLTLDRAKAKKEIIQNSIYGIDIEKGAVDIARLRFWLALVVDEDEPQPLPNLDYKIMQGNSLLERFEGIDLSKIHNSHSYDSEIKSAQINLFSGQSPKRVSQNTMANKVEDLIKTYFNADTTNTKRELHKLIDKHILDHIHFTLQDYNEELSKQAKSLKKSINNKVAALSGAAQKIKYQSDSKDSKKLKEIERDLENVVNKEIELFRLTQSTDRPFFLWHLFFKDVFDDGGFDIVIGNPPYVQLQKMGKHAEDLSQANFDTFNYSGDIYCLFYEIGIRMLKPEGILSFITSNKWMRARYGESLRNYFIKNTNPLALIDFGGFQVFESATVDTNILIVQKSLFKNNVNTCVLGKGFSLNNMSDYFRQNSNMTTFSLESSWIVLSSIEQNIKTKIEKAGVPLKDWDINIYRGILTGYNEAFIIDSVTKDKLVESSPNSAEIIRPILSGKDIKRYQFNWDEKWIIFTRKGIDIDQYPSIKDYLLPYYENLRPRNNNELTGRKPGPYKWFEIQDNVAYYKDFEKQKIAWGNLALNGQFAIVDTGYYINAPSAFIATDDVYLIAILNSKLADFYIQQLGVKRNGGYFEYKPMFVEQLPIPLISKDIQQQLKSKVEKLLKNPALRSALEREIDEIVFSLYNITIEEKHAIYKAAVTIKSISAGESLNML